MFGLVGNTKKKKACQQVKWTKFRESKSQYHFGPSFNLSLNFTLYIYCASVLSNLEMTKYTGGCVQVIPKYYASLYKRPGHLWIWYPWSPGPISYRHWGTTVHVHQIIVLMTSDNSEKVSPNLKVLTPTQNKSNKYRHICLYVHIYTHVSIYTCIIMYTCIDISICIHTHTRVSMYLFLIPLFTIEA